MKTYAFNELTDDAQHNANCLYMADADYVAFIDEQKKEYPEEIMFIENWAHARGLRFTKNGEIAGIELAR